MNNMSFRDFILCKGYEMRVQTIAPEAHQPSAKKMADKLAERLKNNILNFLKLRTRIFIGGCPKSRLRVIASGAKQSLFSFFAHFSRLLLPINRDRNDVLLSFWSNPHNNEVRSRYGALATEQNAV